MNKYIQKIECCKYFICIVDCQYYTDMLNITYHKKLDKKKSYIYYRKFILICLSLLSEELKVTSLPTSDNNYWSILFVYLLLKNIWFQQIFLNYNV